MPNTWPMWVYLHFLKHWGRFLLAGQKRLFSCLCVCVCFLQVRKDLNKLKCWLVGPTGNQDLQRTEKIERGSSAKTGRRQWIPSSGGGLSLDQEEEDHTFHFHLGPGWATHGLPGSWQKEKDKKKMPFLSIFFILRGSSFVGSQILKVGKWSMHLESEGLGSNFPALMIFLQYLSWPFSC